MNKPVMKRDVAIILALKITDRVYFKSTDDAVTEFKEFGKIEQVDIFYGPNSYELTVDQRYDFEEVVKYIEDYG